MSAIFSVVGCSAGISEPPPHEKGGSANSGGKSGSGSGGTTTGSGGTTTGSGGYMPNSGGTTFGSGGAASGGHTNAMGGQGSGGTPQGTGGAARGGMSNMNSGGSGFPPPGSGGRPPMGAGGSTNPPPPGSGGRTGMPGAGGAAGSTSAPGTTCTEADKSVSSNGTGKHCGYTYEYWKDSGSGTLNLTKDGFGVQWSGINDLLGRKGIRPGSADLVVKYSADYQPNGNSYLCIYGWTKNPLVEYYIVDSWGSWRPPGGQGKVGSVSSDEGDYEVYKISKNGPSIEGNGAFTQYWSVRTAKKTSGTITINNHFTAWKGLNMPMGSFYEVSMTVEGYQSSGKADVKFTMQ